ncbi:MAG: histidinol dehydrogenase [Saprospiraceae bacterium]|nr:histidinol dehydrogenase [Saprospiraceae bacterium]
MKIYKLPAQNTWDFILQRPTLNYQSLENVVSEVLQNVKIQGDQALMDYTARFDQVHLESLAVSPTEMAAAIQLVPQNLKLAIQTAKRNIEQFHRAQISSVEIVQTMPGVECWRKNIGIEKVGLYIPGGTAPLFSTVLMLGVPAKLAGCKEIILCSPPDKSGNLHPAILFAADLVGVTQVYKVGGAQAIAAMAYGTASIPAVYKIFGPGNQYVTAAKQLVNKEGVAIDMPAGPSEVLVCADATANPAYVAADLLSQAEHGVDSQVVLVAFQETFVEAVLEAIEQQLSDLPRKAIARQALQNSVAILVENQQQAQAVINYYAPEHLILALDDAEAFSAGIINAGSIFLGHYTPESVGDYASGTNHTLPTNGYAKAYSGVSLDSFVKKITFQKLTQAGLAAIASTVETMAIAEDLDAHKRAVSIRLKN